MEFPLLAPQSLQTCLCSNQQMKKCQMLLLLCFAALVQCQPRLALNPSSGPEAAAALGGAFSADPISFPAMICGRSFHPVLQNFLWLILFVVYLHTLHPLIPLPVLNSTFFPTLNLIATHCPSHNYMVILKVFFSCQCDPQGTVSTGTKCRDLYLQGCGKHC